MPGGKDYAYLAGLFDGEGSVEVRYNTHRRGRAPDWTARLMVFNTDGRIMEWLVSTFGGRVRVSNPRSRPLAKRDLYCWTLAAKKDRAVIEGMRPYLRIKGEQVDALLALVDLMGPPGSRHVPEHVMAQRLALVDEVRELKWKEHSYAAG